MKMTLNELLKHKEQLEDELAHMRENLSNKECELEQLNLQIAEEQGKTHLSFNCKEIAASRDCKDL